MTNLMCLIPARKGSKGVKGKNKRMLGGRPLVSWSLELACEASDMFSEIVLSTDDPEIAAIGENMGVSVPFMRPPGLAADSSKTIDVVKHALAFYRAKEQHFDAVMILQPTTPFRALIDIEKAIQIFSDKRPDSVISVVQTESHHPILMKQITDQGYLTDFFQKEPEGTRRQDYRPRAFLRNGCIYLTDVRVIDEKTSLWGDTVVPYIMPEQRSINIDSELDFKICEALLAEMS